VLGTVVVVPQVALVLAVQYKADHPQPLRAVMVVETGAQPSVVAVVVVVALILLVVMAQVVPMLRTPAVQVVLVQVLISLDLM
jgi:predicted nicotinamide N-methyase